MRNMHAFNERTTWLQESCSERLSITSFNWRNFSSAVNTSNFKPLPFTTKFPSAFVSDLPPNNQSKRAWDWYIEQCNMFKHKISLTRLAEISIVRQNRNGPVKILGNGGTAIPVLSRTETYFCGRTLHSYFPCTMDRALGVRYS